MPYFDKYYLNEITPKLVADYKTERRRDRYHKGKRSRLVSVATINRELCCLKVLFRKAVEWGRLTENPSSTVKVFKETPEAPRLLEEGEISRLLEAMPEHHKALVACAVYAGLRRMGHRDLKTTLRYAHLSPDHEKAAIERLRYQSSHQVDTKAAQ